MKFLRRLFAASAAVIVAMASGVLVAHSDTNPSVYTTPGGQVVNGRLWNTTCEKYSSNVVRCRTNIWATTVTYRNGRYVQRTGWTFNNLSYLPSSRSSWATNNLGRTNPAWTSAGRQWRTECDTAATGRGGCRSYMLVKTVATVKSGSGNTYVNKDAWVFNNVVLFSSPTVPPVTTVPAWIIDQSRLSPTGLGPLQLGTSMKSLQTLGYFYFPNECQDFGESQSLENRGIDVRTDFRKPVIMDVNVYGTSVRTVDGAHVGMTLAQLKTIYGAALRQEYKHDIPGDTQVSMAVVTSGVNELVFGFDVASDSGPLKDTDVINNMIARRSSPDLIYDGC